MNNTKQISSRVNPVSDERRIAGRERFIGASNFVLKGLEDQDTKTPSDGFTFAALAAFTAIAALIHAPVDIAVAFLALRSERKNIDPGGIFLSGIAILIRSVPGVNGQAIH